MKKITLLILTLSLGYFTQAQYLTEGFESGTIPPAGWTHNQTNANETWTISTTNPNTGTNSAQVAYDAALGLQDETLTSPVIDLSSATNPQLVFYVNMSYYWGVTPFDNYDAIVSVFDGTTTTQIWTEADLGTFTSYEWYEITLDLSAYAGNSNVQLLFNYYGSDGASLDIDDILVEEAPTCNVPEGFTAGSVTTTSFELNWTDINPGTPTWEIEWGANGFTQGGGTTVSGLTSPTYTFSPLTANTTYDFYIRTNCGGSEGDSQWVGPISFTSAYDCSTYGLPYSEDWASSNAYFSCYTTEDSNVDDESWSFNTGINDLDGDGTFDNFANVFPSGAGIAKDDWLFTPAISGTMGAEYSVTVIYNSVDVHGTANESFNLVIADTPSSTAVTQSTIGTYTGITQSGAYGDTGGNDLITQAYSSTATYTAPADGDFYVGIHANTSAANSDVFFVLGIQITETLSVNDFDRNNFTYNYNKDLEVLNIESSNSPFDGIEIYSLLGQQVISKSLSTSSESINVSSLNDGVYLAKVNIGGNSKTIKFVKN
ncbi:T9SS type A sorting domain-containing protein [Winogradskyella pulchriflava]|uniref:T9SS type A sorting domain-containing protein n=1 Tax=Winogradskyella pulchriflava TaxID=1110688 RepID=A0ABV6Q404_9FLAO